jgi:hypothetical protein
LAEAVSDGWLADARLSVGWWVVALSEAETDAEKPIMAAAKTVTPIHRRLIDALPLLLMKLSSPIQCLFS